MAEEAVKATEGEDGNMEDVTACFVVDLKLRLLLGISIYEK